MSSDPERDDKATKKEAKAHAKAAKKEAKAEQAAVEAAHAESGGGADEHAERSLRASEEKVRLERWRTAFAAIGAVVAAGTLLVMLMRGCGG